MTAHAYDPLTIKAQLGHPVIDSDGHYMEFMPVFREQFLEIARDLAGSGLYAELAAAEDLRS